MLIFILQETPPNGQCDPADVQQPMGSTSAGSAERQPQHSPAAPMHSVGKADGKHRYNLEEVCISALTTQNVKHEMVQLLNVKLVKTIESAFTV